MKHLLILTLLCLIINPHLLHADSDEVTQLVEQAKEVKSKLLTGLSEALTHKEAWILIDGYIERMKAIQTSALELAPESIASLSASDIESLSISKKALIEISSAISKNNSIEYKNNPFLGLKRWTVGLTGIGLMAAAGFYIGVPNDVNLMYTEFSSLRNLYRFPLLFIKLILILAPGVAITGGAIESIKKYISFSDIVTRNAKLNKLNTADLRVRLLKASTDAQKRSGKHQTKRRLLETSAPKIDKSKWITLLTKVDVTLSQLSFSDALDSRLRDSTKKSIKKTLTALKNPDPDFSSVQKTIASIKQSLLRLGLTEFKVAQMFAEISPIENTNQWFGLVMPEVEYAELSRILSQDKDYYIVLSAPIITADHAPDDGMKIYDVSVKIFLAKKEKGSDPIYLTFKVYTEDDQTYDELIESANKGEWKKFFDALDNEKNHRALQTSMSAIKAAANKLSGIGLPVECGADLKAMNKAHQPRRTEDYQ